MSARAQSGLGVLLLLTAPWLYEAVDELGLRGVLPTLYPRPAYEISCCATFPYMRPHDIPLPLFLVVHLAASVALLPRRADPVAVALFAAFLPAQLLALSVLTGPLAWTAWTSVLLPAAAVSALVAFRALEAAARVARACVGLLLLLSHALIWAEWKGDPLAFGAAFGIVGGLLIAAGELMLTRDPASSASASPPCPAPSPRTSWRRA